MEIKHIRRETSDDVVAVFGEKARDSRFSFFYRLPDNLIDAPPSELQLIFDINGVESETISLGRYNSSNVARELLALSCIDINGKGLEIGPSHHPLLPKHLGYDIEIIDHADQITLKEKYRGLGVDLNAIEPVDYVWDGRSYAELTGKTGHYDYILASHLIEHTVDLLSFFYDCAEVMKTGGVLSLIIPDKRYCFDYFRTESSLAQVIDTYLQKPKNHSPGICAEFFLKAVLLDGLLLWKKDCQGTFEHRYNTPQDALQAMETVIERQEYLDVHHWVFTPSSFMQLISDLQELDLMPFKIINHLDNDGFEFFVALQKQ